MNSKALFGSSLREIQLERVGKTDWEPKVISMEDIGTFFTQIGNGFGRNDLKEALRIQRLTEKIAKTTALMHITAFPQRRYA